MPVPKRRTSRSKRDSRRAHHDKLVPASIANCSRCGAVKEPHRVCPECGYYKDREVIVTESLT